MKSRKLKAAAALVVGSAAAAAVEAPFAFADITGYTWYSTGGTLQNGSRSNVAGFWQTLLCSNAEILVDGWFGPSTEARTASFQQDFLNLPPTGVVNSTTWWWAQFTTGTYGPALTNLGSGYYNYYAGGNAVGLYWGGSANNTWKFHYNPGSKTNHVDGPSSQWIVATTSRTISGGGCVYW